MNTHPASRNSRAAPDRDFRPSGERDFSFEFDFGSGGMIADKVGDDILDDLDEFLECVRLDIEAGNVRGYDVVTARGFVIADSYDVAHDSHLGAGDFGQRPASQTDALPIHKMGLSGPECKFYGLRSQFLSVSVRRMAAARGGARRSLEYRRRA